MPESQREVDVAAAEAAATQLIQGEILELRDACVVLAHPEHPLSDEAAAAAEEIGGEPPIVVGQVVDQVVIVSQTCDLARTTSEKVLCQVAPVVRDDNPTFCLEATRGRHPGWAGLPWLSGDSLADLSRITSIERSLLVGVPALGRPETAVAQLHFAAVVSRHFTRPALPDSVCDVLLPFLNRVKGKHDKESPEGRCLSRVLSMRVEAHPDLDSPSPDLVLIIVVPDEYLPPVDNETDIDDARIDNLVKAGATKAAEAVEAARTPREQREAWQALGEIWAAAAVNLAESDAAVGSLRVDVLSDEDLSFGRSLRAPELDLAYLTSRARAA